MECQHRHIRAESRTVTLPAFDGTGLLHGVASRRGTALLNFFMAKDDVVDFSKEDFAKKLFGLNDVVLVSVAQI